MNGDNLLIGTTAVFPNVNTATEPTTWTDDLTRAAANGIPCAAGPTLHLSHQHSARPFLPGGAVNPCPEQVGTCLVATNINADIAPTGAADAIIASGLVGGSFGGGAGGFSGIGVYGHGRGHNGVLGIGGYTDDPDNAVASGNGVEGQTNAVDPNTAGVRGSGRKGVIGSAAAHAEGVGVHGVSGVDPETGLRVGLAGRFDGDVKVFAGTGDGVNSTSTRRNGVQGTSTSQVASGVYGENLSRGGYGVAGRSNATPTGAFGTAVLGDNTSGGYAGYFTGRVEVLGPLVKSGGGFRIDHPLEPENRYLNHSFVESPDMMNVYNGNVVTDGDGSAVVELPGYFEALNADFRYQLTVIGDFAQAVVAREVRDNRFTVRTDRPRVKVSWQVTGVRQDAWARAHRPEIEPAKADEHRGRYLTPVEHGATASAALHPEATARPLAARDGGDGGPADPWASAPPVTWPPESARWPEHLARVFGAAGEGTSPADRA
jgi:hypothetical protein